MPTLTVQQRTDLQAEITANDIAGFYALLESYGDSYGALGSAVTNNDTWQGELANKYAASAAQNNSVDMSYGSATWLEVNKDVAQNYLNAYNTNNGGQPTQEQIQTAHNVAYDDNGLDADDWFPNKLLNDSGDPDALWADYVTNEGAGDLIEDAWGIAKDNMLALTLPPMFMAKAVADMEGLIDEARFSNHLLNALRDLSSGAKTDLATDFTGTDIADLLEMLGNIQQGTRGFLDYLDGILGDLGGLIDGLVPDNLQGWVDDVVDLFGDAEATSSPLVLDLDGGGIDLVALGAAGSVYWNITNGDFVNAAGWIGDGSGLLCIDLNENGVIDDHSELFGTAVTDGFTVLSAYDSNSSDTITSADTDWDELLVWTDDNNNGYSESTELHTLDELLITSIDIDADAVSYDIAGNHISHESTFTIDGNTRDIVDAWFAYDTVNTTYVADYELDIRAMFLPTLRGYGNLPDLHIAMSLDEDLLDMVQDFFSASLSEIVDPSYDLDGKVRDILFQWAGVTEVDPGSRGAYIDARYLETLEALLGREFDWLYGGADPGSVPASVIMDAWVVAVDAVAARLITQGAASELFVDAAYNPVTDAFEGDLTLDLAAIADLSDNFAPSDAADSVLFWRTVLGTIHQVVGLGNLDGGTTDDLDDIIQYDDPSNLLTYDLIADALMDATGQTLNGDSNANVLLAGGNTDTLNANGGHDFLFGDGNVDNLYGGAGNDTYVFSLKDGGDISNADLAYEELNEGTDKIRFAAGIDPDEVFSWTDTSGNLYLQYSKTDIVQIHGSTSSSATRVGEHVESVIFADATVWDLTAGLHLHNNDTGRTMVGSAYGDVIEGGAGNDIINGYGGADTLIGGDYVDYLYGGAGNDSYVFSLGDGEPGNNDEVVESLSEGTDTIEFSAGINPDDVYSWTDSSGNLYLKYSTNDVIKVQASQSGGQTRVGEYLEQVVFDDATVWNLTAGLHLKNDNTGRTIEGSSYGDVIESGSGNDTLNGYGGNDTLKGGAGSDGLYGDSGNDLYVYSAGQDTVNDTAGSDTLWITGGITVNDITFTDIGAYDTRITITPSVNVVNLDNLRSGTASYHVETILFDDGFYADLPSYNSWLNGTSGNDVVAGNGSANVMIGFAGNDDMDAGAANDNAHGGAGNDDIHGDAGDDLLHGGAGDDVLYGDDGLDTLYGGSGTDTFIFEATESFNNIDVVKDFNIANDDDVLDISDILDATSYNHGVDAITDWVEITTSGSDSIVKIDRDGTGGTYSMTQIATLQGVTGLTDEAALVSSGNLIAA